MTHRRIEGDCLEVMRELPRGHYDLLLTDPPYSLPASYATTITGNRHKRRWSDMSIMSGWWATVMQRAIPTLRPKAVVAVFANPNAIASWWPVMYEACCLLQLVVWDKGDGGVGAPFQNSAEYIIVGTMGDGHQGKRPGAACSTVLRCPAVPRGRRVHPSQKPVQLLATLSEHLCPDGGRVLDPFAGSFSTEAACDSLGLECTSIEWGEAFAMPDEQTELFERPAACSVDSP